MHFPFEIYKLLPKPLEYFKRGFYLPLPKSEVLRLIEEGLKKGILRLKNGEIYPNFELPLADRKKENCYPEECFNFISKHSKGEFYQAKVMLSFKEHYLRRLLEDIPLVKTYKYLSIGEGNCLVDCLVEISNLSKEQFLIFDIDKEVVRFHRDRGYKAFYGDTRFLSGYIIPESPFDVIFSYHIEYYQTYEIVNFANANLRNYGNFYLAFASAELEDREDFYSVFETLWHFGFWITEFNPLYIKAIKMGKGFKFQ